MDNDLEQFQKDLLDSVRQMKAGKGARVTEVQLSAAAEARAKVGVSQNAFVAGLGARASTTYGSCADAAARGKPTS